MNSFDRLVSPVANSLCSCVLVPIIVLSMGIGINRAADPPQRSLPPNLTAATLDHPRAQWWFATDNLLHVRDANTLEPLHTFSFGSEKVLDIAFHPYDGSRLVTGGAPGQSGRVERWAHDGDRAQEHWDQAMDVMTKSVWDKEGNAWVQCDWKGQCLIRETSGKVRCTFSEHTGPVLAACWLERPSTIATAGVDATIRIWNPIDGRSIRTLNLHTQPIVSLTSFPSRDGASPELMASASRDGTIRLWQPAQGRLIRFARPSSPPTAMHRLGQGLRVVVSLKDDGVLVIDLSNLAMIAIDTDRADRLLGVIVSESDHRVLVLRESGPRWVSVARD